MSQPGLGYLGDKVVVYVKKRDSRIISLCEKHTETVAATPMKLQQSPHMLLHKMFGGRYHWNNHIHKGGQNCLF